MAAAPEVPVQLAGHLLLIDHDHLPQDVEPAALAAAQVFLASLPAGVRVATDELGRAVRDDAGRLVHERVGRQFPDREVQALLASAAVRSARWDVGLARETNAEVALGLNTLRDVVLVDLAPGSLKQIAGQLTARLMLGQQHLG